ncbi:MAG: hypothetical protein KatS3mg050_1838 [Litorilinea sp.]|nr:MAG: hypothetical protein KatS3mg050_1838 [Litorilinea sp.]
MGEEWRDSPFSRLSGRTHAYNEGHLVARLALMRHITGLDRYEEIVRELAEEAGLHPIVVECQGIWRRLLAILGPDNFQRLREGENTFVLEVEDGEEAEAIQRELQELVERLCDALERFVAQMAALRGDFSDRMADRLIDFVKDELRLPWAWVAYELIEQTFYAFYGAAHYQVMHKDVWYEPSMPPAPPVTLNFQTYPDEPWEEAARRLEEEVAAVLGEFTRAREAHEIPKGKRLSKEVIERNVGWFFRRHVLGESIRSIARSGDGTGIEYDRKLVRDGINQVMGLLSVSGLFWKEIPEEEILALGKDYWAWPEVTEDEDDEPPPWGE